MTRQSKWVAMGLVVLLTVLNVGCSQESFIKAVFGPTARAAVDGEHRQRVQRSHRCGRPCLRDDRPEPRSR